MTKYMLVNIHSGARVADVIMQPNRYHGIIQDIISNELDFTDIQNIKSNKKRDKYDNETEKVTFITGEFENIAEFARTQSKYIHTLEAVPFIIELDNENKPVRAVACQQDRENISDILFSGKTKTEKEFHFTELKLPEKKLTLKQNEDKKNNRKEKPTTVNPKPEPNKLANDSATDLLDAFTVIVNDPIWKSEGKDLGFHQTKIPASISEYKRKAQQGGLREFTWESIKAVAMKKLQTYTGKKIINLNELRERLNDPSKRHINRADDLVRLHIEVLSGNVESLKALHRQLNENSKEKQQNLRALAVILKDPSWQKAGKGLFGRKTPDSIKRYIHVLNSNDSDASKWIKIKNIANEKIVAYNNKSLDRSPELIDLHTAILKSSQNDPKALLELAEKVGIQHEHVTLPRK